MTKPDAHDESFRFFDADSDERPEEVVANEDAAALIERLTAERDEAIDARKRALADFANFQRRAGENELRARDAGVLFAAKSLLPVLDQMDLSLAANLSSGDANVSRLLEAVAMLRAEIGKAFERIGIARVEPAVGDEFDPHVHEAVMRQAVDGVPGNRVANCFQSGYLLGEIVLRPAKVSVTPE